MTTANDEQERHWNDDVTVADWVNGQAAHDATLAPFIDPLLDAAHAGGASHVLDIGCGCGATTLAAARRSPDGHAHGVDLSRPMLARAADDAAVSGVDNASFEQADAQIHDFEPDAFDAAISRFGVMFFADPAAFDNIRRAIRPGGRLAFVSWQPLAANEWLLVPGAALAEHVPLPDTGHAGGPGMFALAEPDRVRQLLGVAGWHDIDVTAHHTSMLVGGPGDLDTAVEFLAGGSLGRAALANADRAAAGRAVDAVRGALAPHLTAEGVRLGAAVWLVTAET